MPVLWDSELWELLSDVLVVSLSVELLVVGPGSLCEGLDPLVSFDAVGVSTTGISGTVTGTLGMTGTAMELVTGFTGLAGLSGLTGEVGLVGLVSDLTHELAVVIQSPQTGVLYGVEQKDVRVWVIDPVKPVSHARLWL